jgi:hypothetical protein
MWSLNQQGMFAAEIQDILQHLDAAAGGATVGQGAKAGGGGADGFIAADPPGEAVA